MHFHLRSWGLALLLLGACGTPNNLSESSFEQTQDAKWCWGNSVCSEGQRCVLNTCRDISMIAEDAIVEQDGDLIRLVEGNAREEGSHEILQAPVEFSEGAHTLHTLNGTISFQAGNGLEPPPSNVFSGVAVFDSFYLPVTIHRDKTLVIETPLSDVAWEASFDKKGIATWKQNIPFGDTHRSFTLIIDGDSISLGWEGFPLLEGTLKLQPLPFQPPFTGSTRPSETLQALPEGWHPAWEWAIENQDLACDWNILGCTSQSLKSCSSEVRSQGYALPEVLSGELGWSWEECQTGGWVQTDGLKRSCWSREAFDCSESMIAVLDSSFGGSPELLAEDMDEILRDEIEGAIVLSQDALVESAMAYRTAPSAPALHEKAVLMGAVARNFEIFERYMASNGLKYLDRETLRPLVRVDLEIRRRLIELDPTTAKEAWFWRSYLESLFPENDFPAITVFPIEGMEVTRAPWIRTAQDVQKGVSDLDLLKLHSAEQIQVYGNLLASAESAFVELDVKYHDIDASKVQLETLYDAKLRELCGPGEIPQVCGVSSGRIAELGAQADAARIRVKKAGIASSLNLLAITVEEDRISQILASYQAMEATLDEYEGRLIQIRGEYGEKRDAARMASAERDCIRYAELAALSQETLHASCQQEMQAQLAKGYSVFGWNVPDPAGAILAKKTCDAKRSEIQANQSIQCGAAKDQAELQGAMEELDRLESSEVMVVNNQINQMLREGAMQEQVINSASTVRNMMGQILWHDADVEGAQKDAEAASIAWLSAYLEVASIMMERENTISALIENDPENPYLNPAFLWARRVLGQKILSARARTKEALSWYLQALEMEIGEDLPSLWNHLSNARRSEDFANLAACISHLDIAYAIARGVPQDYSTTISLREDIWDIQAPIQGPDGMISVQDQFQERFNQPQDTIELPVDPYLFGHNLCDTRIQGVRIDILGGNLGNLEAVATLGHLGMASYPTCGGDWRHESTIPWEVSIETSINGSSTNFNTGYAGWPLYGSGWYLKMDPDMPMNKDLDFSTITDIRITFEYNARTIQAQSFPVPTTCE